MHEPESHLWPPISNYDHSSSSETHLTVQDCEAYCTLDSFSGSSNFTDQTSQFTMNENVISHKDSHSLDEISGSPVSKSCLSDDFDDLRHKILELETAMLGPDFNMLDTYNIRNPNELHQTKVESEEWNQMMETVSKRELKGILCACAKAIEEDNMFTAEWLVSELRQMVSVSGEPIQRIGAYVLEALIARLASSGSLIYKSLRCKEPLSNELLSYMHILYEACPYFKFGYMSANGAIAEAIKDERRVHIIDFQISQGTQWLSLIQALSARPGGAPMIRITGIDDPTSAHARGGGLEIVGKRLNALAKSCKVPLEFDAVEIPASELQLEDLRIQSGEAIAVNFAITLHHIPDEGVTIHNHRDRIVRLAKSLSPKVVTLVEQECNTNKTSFFPRFLEMLKYYTAIFESIDVFLPRENWERINVEQHCLAREIVNIVACEGIERVERHELLEKWKSRFVLAGFKPYPLSTFVNSTIKALLQNYCEKYTLEERDGVLYLGWMNQILITSCAWV